jgi:hypothetical protein
MEFALPAPFFDRRAPKRGSKHHFPTENTPCNTGISAISLRNGTETPRNGTRDTAQRH